jgi:hypothetical protein
VGRGWFSFPNPVLLTVSLTPANAFGDPGIFEDKVANVWCASNVLIKWKLLFSPSWMAKVSFLYDPSFVLCGEPEGDLTSTVCPPARDSGNPRRDYSHHVHPSLRLIQPPLTFATRQSHLCTAHLLSSPLVSSHVVALFLPVFVPGT